MVDRMPTWRSCEYLEHGQGLCTPHGKVAKEKNARFSMSSSDWGLGLLG